MIAYQAGPWRDLFEVGAESAATLSGLLFVAVSLNLKQIMAERALPHLAARAVGLLLALLLTSVLALAPGQPRAVLGAELAVLGVTLSAAASFSVARTHFPVQRWQWTAPTAGLALASSVPLAVAGISLIAGAGGGLYWALAELVLGFAIALYYAWVLLVEILR